MLSSAPETMPARPVTLVVPFPPRGTTDVVGRVIAQGLSKRLNQTVLVDNRAGAGGSMGAGAVAKADPDGHTLLLSSSTTFTVNPALRGRLPYDPTKSFASLPDMPTIAESGYPGFAFVSWMALVAPRGVPAPVRQALGRALADTLADPGVRAELIKSGLDVAYEPAEDYDARVARELPLLRTYVHKANIHVD